VVGKSPGKPVQIGTTTTLLQKVAANRLGGGERPGDGEMGGVVRNGRGGRDAGI
jgi:hypothetical protein